MPHGHIYRKSIKTMFVDWFVARPYLSVQRALFAQSGGFSRQFIDIIQKYSILSNIHNHRVVISRCKMKRLLIFLFCVFVSASAMAHSVAYNKSSHIYHRHSCEWAQRCTKNCITIDSADAKRRGGRPCKVCGG